MASDPDALKDFILTARWKRDNWFIFAGGAAALAIALRFISPDLTDVSEVVIVSAILRTAYWSLVAWIYNDVKIEDRDA